uniref:Uncharacterized protein n=1 Tax=Ignisphaera aggregans TaxID=334771 RepID=A0A7J3Z693_9CREN
MNLTFDMRVITRGNTDEPLMWHLAVESVWPAKRLIPVGAVLEVRGFEVRKALSSLKEKGYEIERGNSVT